MGTISVGAEILTHWQQERDAGPLDHVVSAEFRSRKSLNSRERRWISEAVFSTVRNLTHQQFLLEAMGLPDTNENLIRLWASPGGQPEDYQVPEDAAFTMPNDLLSPEALEKALSLLPDREDPADYIRTALSFPDVIASELEHFFGDDAVSAAAALNNSAPLTLRINPLKASMAGVQTAIPQGSTTKFSPWALELSHRVNIYNMPGYRGGWFEVQDEASQLVALLTNVLPGQTVVEVGSGAGGKSIAMAALMENEGVIAAIDTSTQRMEELKKRATRSGVSCITPCKVSEDIAGNWTSMGLVTQTLERLRSKADVVLVDVPCTGSGTVRRSPDLKWREVEYRSLEALQLELLVRGAMYTAPSGCLIYITCALERAQNEEIVEKFLKTEIGAQYHVDTFVERLTSGYRRAKSMAARSARSAKQRSRATWEADQSTDSDKNIPDFSSLASGPYLRSWPHRHRMDGFFGACLKRM